MFDLANTNTENKVKASPFSNGKGYWDTMNFQRESIINIYRRSFDDNKSQMIINWGDFRLDICDPYFFFKRDNFDSLKEVSVDVIGVYKKVPIEGDYANTELIKNILDNLSIRKVKEELTRLLRDVGENTYIELLNQREYSKEFTKLFLKIAAEKLPLEVIQRFIYSELTPYELKEYNIKKSLLTHDDYISFLSTIIKMITYGKDKKRFILWIGGVENIVYFKSEQFRMFARTICDLKDNVKDNLLIFLNFSLVENSLPVVFLLLGEHIASRIDHCIKFDKPELNT